MKSYKTELRTGTASSMVEDAISEMNQLGDELQEWADSMPESLQGGDKHSTIEESAGTLQGRSMPDVEFPCDEVSIPYHVMLPKRKKRSPSREVRLSNAIAMIQAVIEFYEGLDDDHQDLINELAELTEEVEIPAVYS
jgi:hypothetical protein